MAPLRCAAKFDPFLSLDCAHTRTPSTLAQSKERKGSNFAIWQHCFQFEMSDGGEVEPASAAATAANNIEGSGPSGDRINGTVTAADGSTVVPSGK